jgi:hypothetical protein
MAAVNTSRAFSSPVNGRDHFVTGQMVAVNLSLVFSFVAGHG